MPIATIQSDRLRDANHVIPLTVAQYDRMIEQGIIAEGAPIELIDGMMILKDRGATGDDIMTVGREHMWSVKAVGRVDESLRPLGYHMQTQMPIIISSYGEPEPDGVILIGAADDYLNRKPAAGDVTCIIEVADSSLDFDRTTKARAYAEAGIRQYLIVNLQGRYIEEYLLADPAARRYGTPRLVHPGELLALFLRGEERLMVRAEDWIPPR